MTNHRQSHDTPRAVGREVFLRDPAKVVERAKVEGAVAITDREGRARLLICIPTDERPDPIR